MDKKLGPLKTWQWLAIGAAAGVIYYIYKVRQNSQASTGTTPTPQSTDLGPLDPTTGQPYALEGAYQQGAAANSNGSNNIAQNAGPTTLAQELTDLGSIETLISGLNQALPAPTQPQNTSQIPSLTPGANPPATSSVTHPPAGGHTITTHAGHAFYDYYVKVTGHAPPSTLPITNTVYEMWKAGVKVVSAGAQPKANPGHTVTTHPSGAKSASSTAPHNARQHVNVAPPSHQRANPVTHPSNATGHGGTPSKPKTKTGPKRK